MKKNIKENITRAEVELIVRSVLTGLRNQGMVTDQNNAAVQNAVTNAVQQVARQSSGLMGIAPTTTQENKMKLSIKELRSMIREAVKECGDWESSHSRHSGFRPAGHHSADADEGTIMDKIKVLVVEELTECGAMDEMGEGGAMDESEADSLKEAVERKKAEREVMKARSEEKDLSVTVDQLKKVASLSNPQLEKFLKCIKDGHTVAVALRKCK